jgi:hypothetical protein
MNLLKKSLSLILSGMIVTIVGIVGLGHSFGAYGRIDYLLFVGYLLVSVGCVFIGAGVCGRTVLAACSIRERHRDDKDDRKRIA